MLSPSNLTDYFFMRYTPNHPFYFAMCGAGYFIARADGLYQAGMQQPLVHD